MSPADPGWTQTFAVFIPDTDRDRQPIFDHAGWVAAAMTLLRDINGGATALAEAEGQWWNRADGAGTRLDPKRAHAGLFAAVRPGGPTVT